MPPSVRADGTVSIFSIWQSFFGFSSVDHDDRIAAKRCHLADQIIKLVLWDVLKNVDIGEKIMRSGGGFRKIRNGWVIASTVSADSFAKYI